MVVAKASLAFVLLLSNFFLSATSSLLVINHIAMSLYSIIDRSKQATVRPAYQLKNCREKHTRYSNHLTFLARCRAHGIIPNGLRVSLPVRTARADNIANKTSQALIRERIGHARRQKVLTSLRILDLESDLSQSLNTEAGHSWTNCAGNQPATFTVP